VIWLRFYWKTVVGWPAWLLRRGRQLIGAVVLQLGLGFSRARNLRTVSFRPDIGAQDALKATTSKWERGMAARLGVGPRNDSIWFASRRRTTKPTPI
jgi:hypothetical protein